MLVPMKTLPPRLMFSQTVCLAASVLLVWNSVLAQAPVVATDGTWVFANPMNQEREFFTATRLLDGRVLVAGGFVAGGGNEPGAELYDPVSNTWSTATAGFDGPRHAHEAVLLNDGRVLVAGGLFGVGLLTSQTYDPAIGAWSQTRLMRHLHIDGRMTLLADGRALISGGLAFQDPKSVEIYDPETDTWSNTGSLNFGRSAHTVTLLADGRVLVTGGDAGFNFVVRNDAELYDPVTGTWRVTASMHHRRRFHAATLLEDGRVLVTGGESRSTSGELIVNSAEIYDPTTERWRMAPRFTFARAFFQATRLLDGRVAITGGFDDGLRIGQVEIYDPILRTWTSGGELNTARDSHTTTLLSDGRLLVAGGFGDGRTVNTAELGDLSDSP
jgi:Kelch motif